MRLHKCHTKWTKQYSNLFLSCVSETFKDYSSVTYHIMLWKNLSGYVTQPRNPQSATSTYPTKRVNSTRKEQDGKQRNSIGDVWQVFRILYNLHTMRWNTARRCVVVLYYGFGGVLKNQMTGTKIQNHLQWPYYTYFDSI